MQVKDKCDVASGRKIEIAASGEARDVALRPRLLACERLEAEADAECEQAIRRRASPAGVTIAREGRQQV